MSKPWFYCQNLHDTSIILPEDEARHATQVMRLQIGAEVILFDGSGQLGHGILAHSSKKEAVFTVQDVFTPSTRAYGVHLVIAPTKNADRLEWMLEKCVEFGLDSLQFIQTEHSERQHLRLDRLARIARSALKQSQQAKMPDLKTIISWDAFIQHIDKVIVESSTKVAIAHCNQTIDRKPLIQAFAPCQQTYLLIGPEGDFSQTEIAQAMQLGCVSIQLGETRLRTETAGLAAVHTVHLQHQLI